MADFELVKDRFCGLTRIDLLKKIEEETANIFLENIKERFPEDRFDKIRLACLHGNFQGVEDGSAEFFELLALCFERQSLTRNFMIEALKSTEHGFCDFDATLITGSAHISSAYHDFYVEWYRAIQGNTISEYLKANGKPSDLSLLNHYTIIQFAQDGSLCDIPYSIFFEHTLDAVLRSFDACIELLSQIPGKSDEQQKYVEFFQLYRNCLAEGDKDQLEAKWTDLDRLWMDIKYWIQVVHDIEYGYGDPLRIKVIPDFSLRFVDETYTEANQAIERIQGQMVDYFKLRDAQISRDGLNALSSSFAAIYYIPFQTGMSLHFRFSGQSIPNRSQVKTEKGVKIYFDPVSTASRQRQTEQLVREVFQEDVDSLIDTMDPIETLVWHVAAHEVGHAIYNLEAVQDCLHTPDIKSLLEEPRAELAALHTLLLLQKNQIIDEIATQKHLCSFALQDLRRFAMFSSSATLPYTISAIHTYTLYSRIGYISLTEDKSSITINHSKALQALQELSLLFERILDAEDARNGDELASILQEMRNESEVVSWLVQKLHK